MMPSIIFRKLSEIPKFFWRYPVSYLSYAAWSTQGQYKNDMIGQEFDPPAAGEPKLKGEYILLDMYGIRPDISKWWDLAALFCLLIFNRVIFYMVLKYKERASLFLHKNFARTFQRQEGKRTSLKRDQFITSKRHQTLIPLSSQEGLRSPLQA